MRKKAFFYGVVLLLNAEVDKLPLLRLGERHTLLGFAVGQHNFSHRRLYTTIFVGQIEYAAELQFKLFRRAVSASVYNTEQIALYHLTGDFTYAILAEHGL